MSEPDEMTTHVPEDWRMTPARAAQLRTHREMKALGAARRKRTVLIIVIFGILVAPLVLLIPGNALLFIALAAGVVLWLLPGLIANERGHRNAAGVWLLTILLGWTVLGWVGALIWAVYEEKK